MPFLPQAWPRPAEPHLRLLQVCAWQASSMRRRQGSALPGAIASRPRLSLSFGLTIRVHLSQHMLATSPWDLQHSHKTIHLDIKSSNGKWEARVFALLPCCLGTATCQQEAAEQRSTMPKG